MTRIEMGLWVVANSLLTVTLFRWRPMLATLVVFVVVTCRFGAPLCAIKRKLRKDHCWHANAATELVIESGIPALRPKIMSMICCLCRVDAPPEVQIATQKEMLDSHNKAHDHIHEALFGKKPAPTPRPN